MLNSIKNQLQTSSSDIAQRYLTSLEGISCLSVAPGSELSNERFLAQFIKDIALHHSVTTYPYNKEKFEVTLQKAFLACGLEVEMPASKTNPCFDMIVQGLKVSCKTEASVSATQQKVKISKWKEVNKWDNDKEAPVDCQTEFQAALATLDKIYMLRCLHGKDRLTGEVDQYNKVYSLIEIPVGLMQELSCEKLATKKSAINFYLEKIFPFGLSACATFQGGGEKKLSVALDLGLAFTHFTFSVKLDREALNTQRSDYASLSLKSTKAVCLQVPESKETPALGQLSMF